MPICDLLPLWRVSMIVFWTIAKSAVFPIIEEEECFICHIHNYTEYNQQWNVCSAFNPSKCTHTGSSGQPMMRRPESSWGFGALLKGLTSVLDNSWRSRDSKPQPRVTSPMFYPLGPSVVSKNKMKQQMFLEEVSCSPKLGQNSEKQNYTVKTVTLFKITVFYFNIFQNVIYSCDGKAEFSADISPVFISRNYYDMLIWC